jgi:hypothetical protein
VDSTGAPLAFVPDVQDITKPGDELRTFRVYFLFERPLSSSTANQPLAIEYEYDGADSYPKLGQAPEASALFRWLGDAEEMILGVAFPRTRLKPSPRVLDLSAASAQELNDAGYELLEGESFTEAETMAVPDLLEALRLEVATNHYFVVGRRARQVKKGQGFGFIIE